MSSTRTSHGKGILSSARKPTFFLTALLLAPPAALHAADPAAIIHETFDAGFDAKRFSPPIPNKNTEMSGGVLWTL